MTDPRQGPEDGVKGGPRVFLFLQGAASPFHSRLATALRQQGAGVRKVHVCGGERMFWRHPALAFRGRLDAWAGFISDLMRREGVTDLVLFGDRRPYHVDAIDAARALGLRLHLFEEGYFRPGWITLEPSGVNASSDLPRDPEELLQLSRNLADPIPSRQRDLFAWRAMWDVVWTLGTTGLAPLFPHYRRHAPTSPWVEYPGWIGRWALQGRSRSHDRAAMEALANRGALFFLLPLQLDGDYQIRTHSDFACMADAVTLVMASFRRAAPEDALLVIKRHPLDVAFPDRRKVIEALARAAGIADRVVFLNAVDIGALTVAAAGMVVVNSTAATLALENAIPLKVLGRATYDIRGLAHQGNLDDFWVERPVPERGLWQAYRRVVLNRTQIAGGFFSRKGIDEGVRNSAMAMLAARADDPR